MSQPFGAQSMIEPLRRVLLVPPSGVFVPEAFAAAGWSATRHEGLLVQFTQLEALLRTAGVEVELGAPAPADNPDAIYAYDGILVTAAGSILMAPPKPNRRQEPEPRAAELEALGIPVLGRIEPPGTMDAGDTLWLGPQQLAVGLGWRTNAAAVEQLRRLVAPLGIEVEAYDLPSYLGPAFCLHLMSLISLVDHDLAVAAPSLMPVRLLRRLEAFGVHLVSVPDDELDTLATNVLTLSPRRVLALGCNPVTNTRLREAGVEVIELEAPDLCLAGTGGPTCLTRPLWREAP